jgi:hypothetical protein
MIVTGLPAGWNRSITASDGIFQMVRGVVWSRIGAFGCVGDKGFRRRGKARSGRIG